jgi:HK97 family phage prohead protease
MNKYISAIVEKSQEKLIAVASTGTVDRHGEVVSPDGWDLKNFKKNPVLLWGHSHEQLPIGTAKKIWVDGEGKKAKLMFEPVFHEVTELARAVKRLFEDGILKTFSVGFKPIDADGDTYTRQELLEISAVNVPANADAMMLAYKSLKDDFEADTIEKAGIPAHFIEKIGTLEDKLKIVETKADMAVKGLQSLNPQRSKEAALETRQMVLKAMSKATNVLVSKPDLPKSSRVNLVKSLKLATEKLQADTRIEIGKN